MVRDDFVVPHSYKQSRTMSRETKAHNESSGFGKMLFMKKQSLTEQELQMALANGQAKSWSHDGMTLYAAVNVTYSSSARKNNEEQLSNQNELDAEGGLALARLFSLVMAVRVVQSLVQADNRLR